MFVVVDGENLKKNRSKGSFQHVITEHELKTDDLECLSIKEK